MNAAMPPPRSERKRFADQRLVLGDVEIGPNENLRLVVLSGPNYLSPILTLAPWYRTPTNREWRATTAPDLFADAQARTA